NVFLVVIKWIAYFMTKSPTVMSSAVDSLLDILSGVILTVAANVDKGERKGVHGIPKDSLWVFHVSPDIDVLVFYVIVGTLSLQLIVTALGVLMSSEVDFELDLFAEVSLILTIVLKIILYIVCKRAAKTSVNYGEMCNAYATDHLNDVLSNSFGFVFAVAGLYYKWWLDPTGSVCICMYIFVNWFFAALEQVRVLNGAPAGMELIKDIEYVCMHCDVRVKCVEYLSAFHVGSGR
ncbi:cation efflux protein, partial [Kipferlia bialata]